MRTTPILLFLLILAAGSPAMDYFPFHYDEHYIYVDSGGIQGVAGFEGMHRSFGYNDMGFFGQADTYSIWNGNLMLEYWERGPHSEVITYWLEPAVCLLRNPLEVGDFWYTLGHVTYAWGEYDLVVFVEVVEAVELTVPYGTLPVLHLHFEVIEGELFAWSDVWLHEELGIVKTGNWELESIESTVRTEMDTWSDVRALFR